MPTPERSLAQRLAALARANEVRTFRKDLKRDLKAGRVDWRDLLAAEPLDPRLETMRLVDVLLALPWVGRAKVTKAFRAHTISPSKTLGGLSYRQRVELLADTILPGRPRHPRLEADFAEHLAPQETTR